MDELNEPTERAGVRLSAIGTIPALRFPQTFTATVANPVIVAVRVRRSGKDTFLCRTADAARNTGDAVLAAGIHGREERDARIRDRALVAEVRPKEADQP